jgi:hypothetical protein
MKIIKTYNQYLKEGMNIDDIENQDREDDIKEYTFDEICSKLGIFFFNFIIKYNEVDKTFDMTIYVDDIIETEEVVHDFWKDNSIKIDDYLNKSICELLNVKNLKDLDLDEFLLYRYIIYSKNKELQFSDFDKYETDEDTTVNFDFYFGAMSVNNLLDLLESVIEEYQADYKCDLVKYVEYLIKNDNTIFSDKYFLDIIINNKELSKKYSHYLNAKNFDIL